MFGHNRATSDVHPPLPNCLRQGILFTAIYARLVTLLDSGDSPVSEPHPTLGALRLEMCYINEIYVGSRCSSSSSQVFTASTLPNEPCSFPEILFKPSSHCLKLQTGI